MSIRSYFFAGIAVLFPIFITLSVVSFIFRFTENILGKYVNLFIYESYGFRIPGIGLPLAIIIIIIVGFISRRLLSKKIFPHLERLFMKLPFINHIYIPAKQLSKFLFAEERQSSFKKVVLIKYPNPSTYSIGFITNENLEELNRKTDKELVSVLVSTPPSPFTGPIIFLPKNEVILLDITIDQAIKFVISGGIVSP